jgi:hypothetical protein
MNMKANLEAIRVAAQVLVNRAAAAGVVVTIEQKPLQPLAMGNHISEVSVREARGEVVVMPVAAVAYEFHNVNGHAIVDYSEHTHAGHLTADKGYIKRALVYADPEMPSRPAAAPAGFICAVGKAGHGACENWCGNCAKAKV